MRAVLDTNVVVSAILFQRGRLAWLRAAWTRAAFVPLVDRACADELLRVLAYPKFALEPGEIRALLGSYLPYAESVEVAAAGPARAPHCRDPEDRKFLHLAGAGGADVLVTGDRALLELAGRVESAIEAPAVFRRRIEA